MRVFFHLFHCFLIVVFLRSIPNIFHSKNKIKKQKRINFWHKKKGTKKVVKKNKTKKYCDFAQKCYLFDTIQLLTTNYNMHVLKNSNIKALHKIKMPQSFLNVQNQIYFCVAKLPSNALVLCLCFHIILIAINQNIFFFLT